MRVSVQLFARLRELAGQADVDCDVADGATIADVWRAVAARHPRWRPTHRACRALETRTLRA
jgi:molybdopterin converting factor small subunit